MFMIHDRVDDAAARDTPLPYLAIVAHPAGRGNPRVSTTKKITDTVTVRKAS